MPDVKALSPADVVYVYDGSFEGFLCCVSQSVEMREIPFAVTLADDSPPMPLLMEARFIEDDGEKAERVRAAIVSKISRRALELAVTVFCSCLQNKEMRLLKFLLRGFAEGAKICLLLGDEDVAPLLRAERSLLMEAHRLKGFVRFSDAQGTLTAVITPKNFVLPFIARHFSLRYEKEQFIIYDKTHKSALVCKNGNAEIVRADNVAFPQVSQDEEKYGKLWKRFYDAVAIEGRENPRCRMSHMPKRFWENMLEVSDLVKPQDEPR
jgi:probable DNA metabolism protein